MQIFRVQLKTNLTFFQCTIDESIKGAAIGWFKNPLSSQTEKLMAGTKFSDYLGQNHYKKAKKLKHFIHLGLAQGPQSFATYRSISPAGNSGYHLKNHVLVM